MKHIIFLILIAFSFSGCELFPDLERDNHNDEKSENYRDNNDKKTYELEFDHYDFYNSWNKFEPGEIVSLKLYVKNTGTATIKNVQGYVKTSSNYISNLTSEELYFPPDGYQHIAPNEIVQGLTYYHNSNDRTINFKIANQTPSGERITFTLELKDIENREWNLSFEITIQ